MCGYRPRTHPSSGTGRAGNWLTQACLVFVSHLAVSTSSGDSSEEKDGAISEESDIEEKTEVVKVSLCKLFGIDVSGRTLQS